MNQILRHNSTILAMLLLFAVAPLLRIQGGQAAPPASPKPTSDQSFMQANRDDLIASLHLQPAGQSTDIEVQASQILKALPFQWPHRPDLWVCHGCGTSSHPDLGIILDLDQINQILQQEHLNNFQQMLTFIVAHEAGHQLQFAHYGHDLYKRPISELQYYEAQADILAGICLYSSLSTKLDPASAGSLNAALRPIYDLGAEEYALANHPSKIGRFLAARFGYIVGYSRHIPLGSSNAQQKIADFRQQIDFRPGDDDFIFSLRAARRIVQFNAAATKDLVMLVNERKIDFDKNAAHPIVRYKFVYQNRGRKKLNVTIRFVCTSILRADPDNVFGSVDNSADYQTFTLDPGKKQTVAGQLTWFADKDRYPSFVEPPNPLGLIEVEYADGSNPDTDAGTADSTRLGLEDVPVGERNNLVYLLNAYVRASRTGFVSLRGGPGKAGKDSTTYPCNLPLPGSVQNEVTFPGPHGVVDDITIRSTLIRTLDSSVAHATFASTVSLIQAALPAIVVPGNNDGWNERDHSDHSSEPNIFWTQGDYWIVIRQHKDQWYTGQEDAPTYYVVEVTFSGPSVKGKLSL
jgi:hypothetical protein